MFCLGRNCWNLISGISFELPQSWHHQTTLTNTVNLSHLFIQADHYHCHHQPVLPRQSPIQYQMAKRIGSMWLCECPECLQHTVRYQGQSYSGKLRARKPHQAHIQGISANNDLAVRNCTHSPLTQKLLKYSQQTNTLLQSSQNQLPDHNRRSSPMPHIEPVSIDI